MTVELFLLLQDIERHRLAGLFLEGQMHAFMPAILFGMSWLNALDSNP